MKVELEWKWNGSRGGGGGGDGVKVTLEIGAFQGCLQNYLLTGKYLFPILFLPHEARSKENSYLAIFVCCQKITSLDVQYPFAQPDISHTI